MKRSVTGAYNKRVTLLYPNGTLNENKEPNYSSGATVWATFDVRPPGGRVIQVNNMEAPQQTRWIKIRYRSGIDHTWRVRYGSEVFDINQPPIDMGMMHRELYLELKKV